MEKDMKIGNRVIGDGHPPLVIAEIGINHGGCVMTAFDMVNAAHAVGAECIKHQTHVVEDEMSAAAKDVIPGNATTSIYDIMERCALNEQEETMLKKHVEALGMIFLSTPFSRAAADRLERMGVVAYKIGSGECNNYPLIEHIASFGKPMIVSTGMNSINDINKTVKILSLECIDFALLHCTNVYPTPSHLVRLGAMEEMMETWPDLEIGLSDHTVNNNACLAAVALGANILERHFTDSKVFRTGEDIVCSMDPAELQTLITGSKEIALMRGGEKGPVTEEDPCIAFAFATVVTIKPIKRGETLTKENVWVKRPGTGEIPAENFNDILGTVAWEDLEADIHVTRESIRFR
jgi:sialic acid synthase SpsE